MGKELKLDGEQIGEATGTLRTMVLTTLFISSLSLMTKICSKCDAEKELKLFKLSKQSKHGRSSWCKQCHSDATSAKTKLDRTKANINNKIYSQTEHGKLAKKRYKRKRRIAHSNASPQWANTLAVDIIYEESVLIGYKVDHIVPLISPFVCGLHCEDNLQLLPEKLNQIKGNRYWNDM